MAQRQGGKKCYRTINPLSLCIVEPFFYLWPVLEFKMRFFYNLGVSFYTFIIWILSPFNKKARLWVNGRRQWYGKLKQKTNSRDNCIWVHCASLGEFEQGRPIIEAIKKERPDIKIFLTFFSPSGYEIRKDYQHADAVFYLPAGTPANSRKFISLVNPSYAIFVKYEFWNNYLSELRRKGIPLYLVSGVFRDGHYFFRWYGSFLLSILKNFTWMFVQDQQSSDLLRGHGFENVTLAGDTRFDRVFKIAGSARKIPEIELFKGEEKLFIAGSSWRQDEEIIAAYINKYPEKMKWILAPHEIDAGNIERLEKLLKVESVRFSEFNDKKSDARVLIIDNIGMLSSAYRYAYVAAVGGGFGKGIHNILEPACWGIPVMFGPRHEKFREAVDLIKCEGGKSFNGYADFEDILNKWISDEKEYMKAAESSGSYVKQNTGATDKIIKAIL
jgi:3-deoxy-D-manno-octulosonic-acid transferase